MSLPAEGFLEEVFSVHREPSLADKLVLDVNPQRLEISFYLKEEREKRQFFKKKNLKEKEHRTVILGIAFLKIEFSLTRLLIIDMNHFSFK